MLPSKGRMKVSVGVIIIIFLIIFGLLAGSSVIGDIYICNYYVDCLLLTILMILYYSMLSRNKVDVFSPLTYFSIIYFMMFYVTPMYDIVIGKIQYWGTDVFDYGIEGSMLAFVGYLCVLMTYGCHFTFGKKPLLSGKKIISNHYDIGTYKPRNDYLKIYIALGYLISLIANLWYLVHVNGLSVIYILTLGLLGSSGVTEEYANIGFISMLSFCLLSFTLLYIEFGKNYILKIISFSIAIELQIARGFRFYIIQIAIMFFSYYYIRKKKQLKIYHLVFLLIIVIIPVIIMTMFRNSIRAGSGMDLKEINVTSIEDALDQAFWDNFRIYKNFYGVLKVVPSRTPFLFGSEMILYTIIMFVPRAIWPGKPNPTGDEASRIAFGQVAVDGGTAYPNLGEYYYNFGILGIVVCMSLFGFIMKKVENRFRYNATSPVDLMIYCTMLGIILQFIIRGYMPSNFWMLVFCLLPYLGAKYILRKTYGSES